MLGPVMAGHWGGFAGTGASLIYDLVQDEFWALMAREPGRSTTGAVTGS
jgi:hypothetical protein